MTVPSHVAALVEAEFVNHHAGSFLWIESNDSFNGDWLTQSPPFGWLRGAPHDTVRTICKRFQFNDFDVAQMVRDLRKHCGIDTREGKQLFEQSSAIRFAYNELCKPYHPQRTPIIDKLKNKYRYTEYRAALIAGEAVNIWIEHRKINPPHG